MMANSAFSVSGVSSGGSGGGDLLDTITISSPMSELEFTDNITAAYSVYGVRLIRILSTAQGNNLYMRTSANNGSSYDSGASDYAYGNLMGLGGSQYNPHSTGASAISLTATGTGYGLSQVAGNTLQGWIWIWDPSASSFCQISSLMSMQAYFGGNTYMNNINGGGLRQSLAAVNAIKIYTDSSTLASGMAELWGFP